jgi:hypothetical protein
LKTEARLEGWLFAATSKKPAGKKADSHLQQIGRTGQHTSRRLWNWFCLTGAAPFEAGDLFGDVVKKLG